MSYTAKHWSDIANFKAKDLNEIELGLQEAHDDLDILNKELVNIKIDNDKTIKDINNLLQNSGSMLTTLQELESIMANNEDITNFLTNYGKDYLSKSEQHFTSLELKTIYKNLNLVEAIQNISGETSKNSLTNHNTSDTSHEDIREMIRNIQIPNISNLVTEQKLQEALSNINFNDLDLSDYALLNHTHAGMATESFVLEQIKNIPIPDVSEQINDHNTKSDSHKVLFDFKLDKTLNSKSNQVYGVTDKGTQTMYAISKDIVNDAIVTRDAQHIKVPLTPIQNNDAVSKQYLDQHNHDTIYAAKVHSHTGEYSEPHGHPYLPLDGSKAMTGILKASKGIKAGTSSSSAYNTEGIVFGDTGTRIGVNDTSGLLGIYSSDEIYIRPHYDSDSNNGVKLSDISFYPSITGQVSLGTSDYKFKELYLTKGATMNGALNLNGPYPQITTTTADFIIQTSGGKQYEFNDTEFRPVQADADKLNIGRSDRKFKDLYLSGTAYVNKLESSSGLIVNSPDASSVSFKRTNASGGSFLTFYAANQTAKYSMIGAWSDHNFGLHFDGNTAKSIQISRDRKIIKDNTYTYTLPNVSGTVALTSDLNNYVKHSTRPVADAANTTLPTQIINIEGGDHLITGQGQYQHLIHLGGYSANDGSYSSQIAMPYLNTLSDSKMFIRTAIEKTWRPWREVVTATKNAGVDVAGNTKDTYTYGQTAIYAPNGLIMGGSALQAGLVTRGICGIETPSATGAAAKSNLYINYDGDNTYKNQRQLVLQADGIGTHYGNNLYQYAAARGDAVKNYCDNTYLKLDGTNNMTAALKIIANGKTLQLGAGGTDVYMYNSSSGKYLQLKDDGRLCYSDSELAFKSHTHNYAGSSSAGGAANSANSLSGFNQIGGVNYFKSPATFATAGNFSTGISGSITSEGYIKVVSTSGNSNWNSWSHDNNIESNMQEGEPFVFSIEIKADAGATGKPNIYFKSGMGYYTMTGTVGTTFSTLYYRGTWKKDQSISFHFGWSGAVGTFYIRKIAFEKGYVPTDISRWFSQNQIDGPLTIKGNLGVTGIFSEGVNTGNTSAGGDNSKANVWAYKIIGEHKGSAYPLSHAIKLGLPGEDYMDFYEYGANFRFFKHREGASTQIASITETAITSNTGYFDAYSDIRLKENIIDIDEQSLKTFIETTPIKSFNYKSNGNRTVGIIAQDIENIEIDGAKFTSTNEDGYLQVHETKFIYLLWNYCQQLNKRIKELESKVK